jgi:hypothetical protein
MVMKTPGGCTRQPQSFSNFLTWTRAVLATHALRDLIQDAESELSQLGTAQGRRSARLAPNEKVAASNEPGGWQSRPWKLPSKLFDQRMVFGRSRRHGAHREVDAADRAASSCLACFVDQKPYWGISDSNGGIGAPFSGEVAVGAMTGKRMISVLARMSDLAGMLADLHLAEAPVCAGFSSRSSMREQCSHAFFAIN